MASSMLLPTLVAAALAQTSSPTKFICDTGPTAVAYKATYTYQGCYSDPNSSILSAAKINTILVTPQYCATYCGGRGFAYGGLRNGNTCYCGATPNFDNANKANDTQCSYKCPTDPSFACGSYNSMSLYKVDNPKSSSGIEKSTARTPACYTSPLCGHQVCNTSLSISERVASLVNSLTEQEKIFNLVDASGGSERLGLPPYAWWNEATHGVGEAPGVQFNPMPGNFSYATSFPSPILSAAAFDDDLIFKIGQVVGKEGRAFGNNGFSGWDFWAPNMNAFRDPRWGRGLETPGEDPLRVSNYVRAYVPGLQGNDLDHKQIIATCKHYAVYDIETGRRGNSYNPTQQDMADYYMVSFKACVRDAHVGSIMCSYNSVNGIPSCANEYLLQDVLRDHWNFTGPADYVVSDCGAPQAVFSWHNYTNSAADGAAVSLNAGTDLECGTTFLNLNISLAANTTSVARMDQALTRLYHALFNVGYFDSSPYQNLGWSDVGTPDAQQLAYQAAVEGIVLLKNDGVLPAKHPRKVALIGPYANATVQMQGTYSGTAKDIVSPLRAAQEMANWEVTYAGGTAINTTNTTGFTSALSAATQADLVIYLGGLDTSVEKEALDRTTLTWPGNQLDLIEQLAKVSKSLVIVQFGGGQVDDAPLLKNSGVNGIVWAGYPSQDGGPAIMDIITGKVAPAGRLPVTQYPASYVNDVSIYDIELRPNGTYPGRTNRFYTGVPTLPFGYGLSYTTFEFAWSRALKPQYNAQSLIAEHRAAVKLSGTSGDVNDATPFANVEVEVSNTGKVTSDFVGLLFLSSENAGPKPRPLKTLVSYARLHNIKVGAPQNMSLPLTLGSLARADVDGNLVIYPGDYTLFLDVNGNKSLSFNFTITGNQTGNVIDTLPIPKSSYPATVPVHLQAPSRQAYGPNY